MKITILNPNASATSVDVFVSGGTATQGDDYGFINQTITFPSNNSMPVVLTVDVAGDGIAEPDEFIEISLQNQTNGASIGNETIVVQVVDDDGLGNSMIANQEIEMYPNPVTDMLVVNSGLLIEEIQVENLLGVKLIQTEVNSNQAVLNLQMLTQGIYLVKVVGGNTLLIKEIVKR